MCCLQSTLTQYTVESDEDLERSERRSRVNRRRVCSVRRRGIDDDRRNIDVDRSDSRLHDDAERTRYDHGDTRYAHRERSLVENGMEYRRERYNAEPRDDGREHHGRPDEGRKYHHSRPESSTHRVGEYRDREHQTVAEHVGTTSRQQNADTRAANIDDHPDFDGYRHSERLVRDERDGTFDRHPKPPKAPKPERRVEGDEAEGNFDRHPKQPPKPTPIARQNTVLVDKGIRSGTVVINKAFSDLSRADRGEQEASRRIDASDSQHGYAASTAHRPETGRQVENERRNRASSPKREVDLGRASEQRSLRPGEVRKKQDSGRRACRECGS